MAGLGAGARPARTARAAVTRAEAAATEGSAEALVVSLCRPGTGLGQAGSFAVGRASDRRIALWMRLAEARRRVSVPRRP